MSTSQTESTPIEDLVKQATESPKRAHATGTVKHASSNATETDSIRSTALYVGLLVLMCQLIFVYTFFPSFDHAVGEVRGNQEPPRSNRPAVPSHSKYSRPDILQWSGAQSLTWIASLFAPDTPVRLAPALLFFLVAGGFFAALHHPPRAGEHDRHGCLCCPKGHEGLVELVCRGGHPADLSRYFQRRDGGAACLCRYYVRKALEGHLGRVSVSLVGIYRVVCIARLLAHGRRRDSGTASDPIPYQANCRKGRRWPGTSRP